MRRRRQNRKGAPGRVLCPMLAFVLAAVFVIGTPHLSGVAWAVELDRKCSVQIAPVSEGGSMTEDQPGEKVDLNIDLYLVAKARAVSGHDMYDYFVEKDSPYYTVVSGCVRENGGWEYEDDLEGLIFRCSTEIEGDGWEELAREAASAALNGETVLSPDAGGEAGSTLTDLNPGLYLAVARGSELEDRVDYMTVGEDAEGNQDIFTIAYTDAFTYRFRPQLFSLPAKEPENGTVSTANGGEWLYALNGAELKFEQEPRRTSLEIVKNLTRYAGPAAFVFEVEAREGDDVVYSDIITCSFDENAGNSRTVVLEDKIPVGADVTVTEVYSGASYSLTGVAAGPSDGIEKNPEGTIYTADLSSGRATITNISSGEPARVVFTNDYNSSGNGGGAVTNHFERDGAEAEWTWNQYQYNAGAGRWEWNGALPAVKDATVR